MGYTYHYVDEGCDTGDIILQQKLPVEDFDTQKTLYMRIMFEAMNHFEHVLDLVANGFVGKKQEGESSYYPRGCPYDGQINPDWDIEYKSRFIRAKLYPPHPVSKIVCSFTHRHKNL